MWDFDVLAETLPNKGLGDLVHMTMADADDYTNPDYFERGYPMSDLTALMLLHAIYTEVIRPMTLDMPGIAVLWRSCAFMPRLCR